ncbi:phage terminase small subunit [Mycobacteroides abscessus]|uniref:phage terminase small subunit n=1 Tax=Mycobacteroides abscessus TaxID=36809 RepID=UPI0009D152E8|nr:hypothetical protein [Mycobacteroides abscessus]SLG32749.1 Uncharacterised protein [Mycobacteroides abscessus subsp. abscessus]
MSGPAPKRDDQRRRTNKPASYGEAEAEQVGEASAPPHVLGIPEVDEMVLDLWNSLRESAEARFYSEADWHRVRLELRYLNAVLSRKVPSSEAWKTVQMGLNTLLVSPADKRRLGIELKRRVGDEDDEAADEAMAQVFTIVPPTGTDGE